MVQFSKLVDPMVWQYCCDVAASAKFWRGETIGDTNDINMVMIPSWFNGDETSIPSAFRGMFHCYATIVDPSLPEWDHTPSHSSHAVTSQQITMCVDPSLVSLINTLRKGINESALTCICKADVKVVDGFPFVIIYGKEVGLSLLSLIDPTSGLLSCLQEDLGVGL